MRQNNGSTNNATATQLFPTRQELEECREALRLCHDTLATTQDAFDVLKLTIHQLLEYRGRRGWSINESLLQNRDYIQSLVTLAQIAAPNVTSRNHGWFATYVPRIATASITLLRHLSGAAATAATGAAMTGLRNILLRIARNHFQTNAAARDFAASAAIALAERVVRRVAARFARSTQVPAAQYGGSNFSGNSR